MATSPPPPPPPHPLDALIHRVEQVNELIRLGMECHEKGDSESVNASAFYYIMAVVQLRIASELPGVDPQYSQIIASHKATLGELIWKMK